MERKQKNNPPDLKGENNKGAVEGKKQDATGLVKEVKVNSNKEQDSSLTTPKNIKLSTYEAYEPGIGTYSLTKHDLEYGFGQGRASDNDQGTDSKERNNGK